MSRMAFFVASMLVALIQCSARHLRSSSSARRISVGSKMMAGPPFDPTSGVGGKLPATSATLYQCDVDSYTSSDLEQNFSGHVLEFTKDKTTLCNRLGEYGETWIRENLQGQVESGTRVFSRLCKKGQPPQLLEPLAGILRDPRMLCNPGPQKAAEFSIDWLVLADSGCLQPSAKKIFFDAGGTKFMDAMNFFTSQYEKRGITFDHIYVWEATRQGVDAYWAGTPALIRQKWEPRLTFYDGVPCSADPDDAKNNPAVRLVSECQPDDFCAFKLDIDTPSVELPIVQQLSESPTVHEVLDEFFFEHHVHGLMQNWGWSDNVNGSFADSYEMFSKLRRMGVRAHSWI